MTNTAGGADDPVRPSDGEVGANEVVRPDRHDDAPAAAGVVVAASSAARRRWRTYETLRLSVAGLAGLSAGLLLWVIFGTGGDPASMPTTFPIAGPAVNGSLLGTPTTGPTDVPTPTQSLTGSPTPLPRTTPIRPAAPGSVPAPLSISIPDLGIGQRLIQLGVAADRTLEVPKNGSDIGWWDSGPAPGEPGGVVIAGHVTWGGGQPAVFYHLSQLPIGAMVTLDREDGTAATYQITQKQDFPKDHFPNELIYRLDGPPQLYLVTCAGDFISGTYTDNVVVFGDLVSDTRT